MVARDIIKALRDVCHILFEIDRITS